MNRALISMALLAVLLGGGCRWRSDNREQVVVYTPFPEITAKALKRAFEKKHNIKVVMVLEGTTKVFGRLRAEKERPIADVWHGGGGMFFFIQAADEGLLESYVPTGFQELPETRGNLILRDPEWRWCGTAIIALGFAYNPRLVPPGEVPTTWDQLADPRWKGKLEMWDPGVSGTAMLFLD
ncbi:MAG: ABC transporter substrate-binding protein, partial [Candidatus Eremiobacteraeota bacterium]|nr:ABC transporter substrate-binding protein [Candidatus Eremiobacteraeota bacterium]